MMRDITLTGNCSVSYREDMDQISTSELRRLLEHSGLPRLSLYTSTHQAGFQDDPIRFKNLFEQAEELLSEYGLRGPEAQEFLEPARNLVTTDAAFWQQGDGLILFMALCL